MILYHGSNVKVEFPKLIEQNRLLDFVSAHRNGTYRDPRYDLIIGAVADDDVYRTLQVYASGLLTKDQALEALKIKKLFNQYVFVSKAAIEVLKFIEAEEL